MSKIETITLDTLPGVLTLIESDNGEVLRVDEGNGCAGAIWFKANVIDASAISEIIPVHAAPAKIRADLASALRYEHATLNDEDYRLAVERNGAWTGYYLVWIP